MGRKKNKNTRRGGDSDEDDDQKQAAAAASSPDATAAAAEQPKQSRKQKRNAKQQAKSKQNKSHDSDDDDDEVDEVAALLGGLNKKAAYASDDSEDDDDEDDDMPAPSSKPAAKNKKNKKNKGRAAAAVLAAMESSSEEEEDEDEEEDTTTNNDDVEQVAVMMADDDDWGMSKKSKKEKKDKKEKKKKKDKDKDEKKKSKKDKKHHHHHHGHHHDDDHLSDKVKDDTAASPDTKKKSKFELQMEAAMKKKEEEGDDDDHDAAAAAAAEGEAKSSKKKKKGGAKPEKEPEPDWVDTDGKQDDDNEDDDLEEDFYGAPGDEAWTDKSHAIKHSENAPAADVEDLTHGPDGKKLSNKERKKLLKARAAAEREAEYEATAAKASREGAQFACSQTAVNENDPQWENSLDINIPSFSISAAGKILFKDAELSISHGRRYGLVGPNGKGKSTLLKMIASGDLKLPPRIDFLYVEQEVVADDTPAVEAVLRADKVRWDLQQEEEALMNAIDAGDESEEKITRLQEVVDSLTTMGADAAESKARRILYGLGFTMEMQTKPTKMFSGGWRMRISLARALFVEPTLLMLDEPTNHLDLNAVIWLDEYLQKWKKTLFVVSHDQDFLNSVCQEILHIEDLKLISYKGNYDSFKKAEKIKFEQQVKAWEKQEKRLRELKKSGQSREKAQETVKKNAKREAGSKKKNQAIAAGTETAENAELIKRPREYHVKIEFSDVNELGRPVMEVSDVHFRYSPKHPVIFDCVDFGVDMDSRVTVVGPNGAGKSTLIKLLTGELEPTKGEVKRNQRLRMGVYNQHFVDRLPMSKTPVEFLRDSFPDEDYQSIRNRLGKYGLEGHAHEVTMRDLSGGQKARVVFVDLSLQNPHILLLDEPTNNLDIESIDALCDAINEFNGGVVVVTHDQRLIEECDCTLWVVEKKGVTEWKAGFDDYKDNILEELEREVERQAAARREKLEAASAARAEKIARLAKKIKK